MSTVYASAHAHLSRGFSQGLSKGSVQGMYLGEGLSGIYVMGCLPNGLYQGDICPQGFVRGFIRGLTGRLPKKGCLSG